MGTSAWITTPAIQYYLITIKPQSSDIILSFNTALMNIGITIGAGLGGVIIDNISFLNLGWIGGLTVALAIVTTFISFKFGGKRNIGSAVKSNY